MRILFIAISLLVTACGQKGQLYLPSEEAPADTVPAVAAPAESPEDEESAPEEQEGEKPRKN